MLKTIIIAQLNLNPGVDPGLELHRQMHNRAISPTIEFSIPRSAPLSQPLNLRPPQRVYRCYRINATQQQCEEIK